MIFKYWNAGHLANQQNINNILKTKLYSRGQLEIFQSTKENPLSFVSQLSTSYLADDGMHETMSMSKNVHKRYGSFNKNK